MSNPERSNQGGDAPRRVEGDPFSIAVMPDKAMLEEYLRGSHGKVTVFFNTRNGQFERTRNPNLQDSSPR